MVQHVKGSLHLAASLIAMEAEANRLAPNRSTASDGSFPSTAHTAANPTSDHEIGDALDLTHDPGDGFDVAHQFHLIVARQDHRVKYLIHNGTIWKSYPNRGFPAWTPQVYTGPNPHKSHGHVSVLHEHRDDTGLWWPEEDDMSEITDRLDAIELRIIEMKVKLDKTYDKIVDEVTVREDIRLTREIATAVGVPSSP